MKTTALFLALSFLFSFGTARADSSEPLTRPAMSAPASAYVTYVCEGSRTRRTALGSVVRPEEPARELGGTGLGARFRLLYAVGQPVLVVQGAFSYEELSGAVQATEIGPLPAGPDAHYQGAGKGHPGLVFTTRIGWNARLAWSYRAYPVTVLSFLMPPGFDAGVSKAPFEMQIDLRHSVGSANSALAEWNQLYDATCVAEPLTREHFEEQRDFARRGVEDVWNGFDIRAQHNLEAAHAFLRDRLRELSSDELTAALGVSVSALLASEAVKNAPALRAVAGNAYASILKRMAARPALAWLAESLSWRTAGALGLRVTGTALSSGLAVFLGAMELGGSAAQAADFGGPGYFLTERGTRALVAGPSAGFLKAAGEDPLVRAHLLGLAHQLGMN